MIYCDFNASTPTRPEVVEAMTRALGVAGNPSSVHQAGRSARAAIEQARAQVAALAGARADEVVFTSGGTEANNLALAGFGQTTALVSAIEHDSVLAATRVSVHLPVSSDGVVDLDALDRALENVSGTTIVSVMLANNETGVIQPIAEVARRSRRVGALVHCDAVQAAGRLAIDFAAMDVDLMTLSAHKIGGPQGAGALIVRGGVTIEPLIRGGGQERRLRAGTENVAGIVGFGVAADCALRDLDRSGKIENLRDALEAKLRYISPDLTVYGAAAPRLSNTSCVGMPGVSSETQVMAFDLDRIAVSAGAACSSGKVTQSHVLRAMGAGDQAAGEAIRISLGASTDNADIEAISETWGALYRRTRARRAEPTTMSAARTAA